jgi:hypothetical protein
MAPLPELGAYLSSLLKRNASPSPSATLSDLSPRAAALAARAQNLVKRTVDPTAGVTPPENIPNKAVFVLFGLIGAGFVISGIWFFFWAKNGGFYFKEDDWDDYKSTVLRRKGPNGTTLSGATESTDLGGGSVVHGEKNRTGGRKKKTKKYKDFEDDEESQITGSTVASSLGSEMSELKYKAKKNKKGRKKRTEMSEVGTEAETVITMDEEMDVGVQETIRAYRHEKPARVGGLNKQPDGSSWDGSTNDGSSAASELLSHREKTPTNTPTKSKKERKDNYTGGTGGIRKVVSTSEGGSSFWSRSSATDSKARPLLDTTHEDHIKAEAQRLQEKGRAAQRRDFSFRVGDDGSTVVSDDRERVDRDRAARREEREKRRASRSPTKKLPGGFVEESVVGGSVLTESVLGGSDMSSDIGTKSYHHPIPGLSSVGSDYADERRKKRNGGYRRGRGDDLEE